MVEWRARPVDVTILQELAWYVAALHLRKSMAHMTKKTRKLSKGDFGHPKPRQLDCSCDAVRVDELVGPETLANGNLGPLDVVRGESCIRRTARERKDLASLISDIAALAITLTNAAHIAYVMGQRRYCEVKPVNRGNVVFQPFTTKYVLADKRHKCRVLCIVVQCVADAEALEDTGRPRE
jgi:hypothetical protein